MPWSLGKRAVVGYEDGTIRIWDLKQGNPIHVLKGIREGRMFTWALWEEPESQVQDSEPVYPCCVLGTEGHQGPLTCVATNQDGSLILTGSVDCQAKLVSATTGKVNSLCFCLNLLLRPCPFPLLRDLEPRSVSLFFYL